jgi:hypothetical protein
MKRFLLPVFLVLALGVSLFGVLTVMADTIWNMNPQNGSSETGTVTIKDLGNGTSEVVLKVQNSGAVAQPAHIHKGTCAALDPTPAYPLNDVINGTSDTVVPVSLSTLTSGTFAVNVHKSATEITVYVSCGDLATALGMPSEGTLGATPTPSPVLPPTGGGGPGPIGMPTTGSGSDSTGLLLGLALVSVALLALGIRLSRTRVK